MSTPSIVQLTEDMVKAEVTRYWHAFSVRSPEQLQTFFSPDAVTFGSLARNSEPARLTVVRRTREYFQQKTCVSYRLGDIEVMMLDRGTAIAIYTFQFAAKNIAGGGTEEEIAHGRATQVFSVSRDGSLHIVHEHLSEPTRKLERTPSKG